MGHRFKHGTAEYKTRILIVGPSEEGGDECRRNVTEAAET